MFQIINYSVVTNTVEPIVLFSSAMLRKLESMNAAADGIIKVTSAMEVELDDMQRAAAQANLNHLVATGLDLNGRHYVPFFAGSSDIRKGTSGWIRDDLLKEIGTWAMCGLKTSELNIAVNKYAAYIGLLMSSTRTFQQVYGRALDVRRVCVVPDTYVKVTGKVDFVEGDNVRRIDEHVVEINAFDGAAYIRPEATGGKASTLRAPWVKAMAIPMDFISFAEEHGLSTIIKDYWGNEVDLREIDLVLTESCFKMAGQYKSFQQYQEAFEALGHEICVCVEEHHPRKKAMPYQQLQTLVGGTNVDAMKLAYMTKEVMDAYKDPDQAAGLIGGHLAHAAKLYHGLLAEPYTARIVEESYNAKWTRAIGGKVLGLGYNAFLAPDPIAMLEALYGLPVTGALKAGECYCSNAGLGQVDNTRSPHLDHAHVIMWGVKKPNKYFMGPTMYWNIRDFATLRLRADYDGDHVWYSKNAFLLEAIRKTDRLLENITVDWVAPKAPKSAINRGTLARFFTSLTQTSQIGIYADDFTKFWAWLSNELDKEAITMEEAREVWCWLTYAGNVLIDAAKHGNANVKPPKRVRMFAQMPLPAFCEYAKADSVRPVGSEYWAGKCAKTNGFADMYSEAVRSNVDEHLHVTGSEEFVFDPHVLMIDAHRKIGNLAGLFKQGRRVVDGYDETGAQISHYEDEGLFQRLAFASARELEALEDGGNERYHLDCWEKERGRLAFNEIRRWVEERGETMEAAYDIICRGVFNGSASEKYAYTMKRAFWIFFGEMTVEVLSDKFCANVFEDELVLPDLDDLDSDDEYVEE